MQDYFAIVTCRNSEESIERALLSIKNQSIQPAYTIIIDDGSTDKTHHIIEEIKEKWNTLYVIKRKGEGYDVKRIVKNWNQALSLVKDSNLKRTDYHLIATDDTIYEMDYAEKILLFLQHYPNVAVVSGTYYNTPPTKPHGAGRFVRHEFFENTEWKGLYPEKMGYESAILYEAERLGFTYKVVSNARFEHTRELGKNHKFYEFGASMHTLGYHRLFALARFANYLITGKITGRVGAFYMVYYYLTYKPKNAGYDSMYSSTLRRFVRKKQIDRLKIIISNLLLGKIRK